MRENSTPGGKTFMTLSESERARVIAQFEAESPGRRLARSRPLSASDKKRWKRFKAKMGRPPIGRGTRAISLTVEKGLLEEADAFARRHGMSRSEFVSRSLRAAMDRAA